MASDNILLLKKVIYKLFHEILNAINNKFVIGGILCDLEKASDCVNHNISLSKLKFYSIKGPAYTLLKSCLQDGYKRVLINSKNKYCNTTSDWGKINHGIPEGVILGPLLYFSLYK